jgi:hypothetical protein
MAKFDDDACDKLIAAAAAALALTIAPEWQAGIRVNLRLTLSLAMMVAEFELPDEAEPAPTFAA